MALGALLMVAGVFMTAVCVGDVATVMMRSVAAASFAAGTIAFAAMQFVQVYEGCDIVIRRLRNIQVIGCVCLILSGLLMLEQTFHIVFPLVATSINGYNNYYHYVHNNWGVLLLIACILELYTTLRISHELKKEA